MKQLQILVKGFAFLTIPFLFSCNFFGSAKDDYFSVIAVKFGDDKSKISLINNAGEVLIEDEFSSNSTVIPIGNLIKEINSEGAVKYWKLKDKKIEQIGDAKYDDGTPFFEQYAVVRNEKGMLSLIDDDGKEVIPNLSKLEDQTIVRVGVVSDGLLRFKNDAGLWGYVDVKGKVVIKPSFSVCENFVNGRARVVDSDGTFKIIDKDGKEIFKGKEGITYGAIFGDYIPYKEEEDEFWGTLDFKGEKVIKAKDLEKLLPWASDKLAVRKSSSEWGVVDLKGEIIGDLRTKFESEPYFSNDGEIIINDDKKVKIFDKNGVLVKEMDDFKRLYPLGSKKYLAEQKNDKFIIIDSEGKELSKDAFKIRFLISLGTTSEAVEYAKNAISIESNYFEFDPVFTKVFEKVEENGVFGINVNSTIDDIIKKYPYANNAQGQNSKNVDRSDDYSYEMKHSTDRKSNNETAISSVELVPSDAPVADTTAVAPYNNSTIKDDYTFLSVWDNVFRPQQRNALGVGFNLSFEFDQYLKKAIQGQDPIYTDYVTTIGYSLNTEAKLSRISATLSLSNIDSKIFWKNFTEKAKAAGFQSSGEGEMVHKNNPSRRLSFSGSYFVFSF